MCGVVSWISFEPCSAARTEELAKNSIEQLSNRGPDGSGWVTFDEGRIGLVHTRLAVIDPTPRSDQPMADAETGAAITYNGEIYNYRELRAQLAAQGARFSTEGDTEVILKGYLLEGATFFRRLRGMYAFVIYDPRTRSLVALRDPLGIKPLYMARAPGRVAFGSTPRAAALGESLPLDPAAAVSLAVLGAVIDPISPYRGVEVLLPATLAIAGLDGRGASVRREKMEPAFAWGGGDRASGIERLANVVGESIEAHFTSDVPVAVFQSAGLDSALISTLARSAGQRPTLITIGFDSFRGTSLDEAPQAAEIARQLGFLHHVRYLDRPAFEAARSAFLHDMQTPTGDGLNTWLASQFCRELGFKVALTGVGGDEIFSGYPSFRQLPKLKSLARLARMPGGQTAFRAIFEIAWRLDRRRSPKLRYSGAYLKTWGRRYLLRQACFALEELEEVLDRSVVAEGAPRFLAAFDALTVGALPDEDAGVRALELNIFMRNVLLRDCDWIGMAHGVEVRTPLVDVKLLRSLCDPTFRCAYRKQDLRAVAAMSKPLVELPRRAKTGFLVPHDAWTADEANADPLNFGSKGRRAWNRQVLRHWFKDWVLN